MSDPTAPTSDSDVAPTCYRHPDRATYISCQRCGRPICTSCQAQAAVGVQCPECVRGAATPAVRRAGGWTRALRPRRSMVTFSLMAILVVVYVVQLLTAGWLTDAGSLQPWRVGAEPWRLLTSAFLHLDTSFVHLLFNLVALYFLGPALEEFLGRARFLALYLVSALGGSLGVLVVYELIVLTGGGIVDATGGFLTLKSAVGASGAIFGLMGAYLPLRKAIGADITRLAIVLGANLVLGFVIGGIAWEAHLGGLAIGAAVGAVYLRTRRREQARTQTLAVAGIAVGILVVIALFVASAPYFYGFG